MRLDVSCKADELLTSSPPKRKSASLFEALSPFQLNTDVPWTPPVA